ncbi:hypothetical protein Dimus_034652 [Dionaea muscipula]
MCTQMAAVGYAAWPLQTGAGGGAPIIRASSSKYNPHSSPGTTPTRIFAHFPKWVSEFGSKTFDLGLSTSLVLALSLTGGAGFAEAKTGVNKPELLPEEYSPVIDVAGFLSAGQENRLAQEIVDLEKDTGYKLRVLAQNYPDTPGLAIKDFWEVDDRTIVFVADPTFGNILNFNVGAQVDLDVPHSFWSRLAGKYGNVFYWKEKGEDASIEAAVNAIGYCLREPVGPNNCLENTHKQMNEHGHAETRARMEDGGYAVATACEATHDRPSGTPALGAGPSFPDKQTDGTRSAWISLKRAETLVVMPLSSLMAGWPQRLPLGWLAGDLLALMTPPLLNGVRLFSR